MIANLKTSQVTAAMRALEALGRLRRDNERVVEFQRRIPLAELWGDGDKASADMMFLDASQHLWNARVDPRRRTYAAGIYTHVMDRYGIVYDQPIVLNERHGGAAIEGVERYNAGQDSIRVSLLAVDTSPQAKVDIGCDLGMIVVPVTVDLPRITGKGERFPGAPFCQHLVCDMHVSV